jgi:hypothetical protein
MALDANEFHREIERAVERHQMDAAYQQNRYTIHPVVGRTQRTSQSAVLRNGALEMLATYRGENMEGDGTVPRVSATPHELAGKQAEFFVDERHASLQNFDAVLVDLIGHLNGVGLPAVDFNLARAAANIAPVSLDLRDAYDATGPITMETHVASRDAWVEMAATVIDVGTGDEVQTQPVEPVNSPDRTVTFTGLPQGTYRVALRGDSIHPVNDVFLVA